MIFLQLEREDETLARKNQSVDQRIAPDRQPVARLVPGLFADTAFGPPGLGTISLCAIARPATDGKIVGRNRLLGTDPFSGKRPIKRRRRGIRVVAVEFALGIGVSDTHA